MPNAEYEVQEDGAAPPQRLAPGGHSPLYPFAPNYLDRAGLRYHYLDQGAGEPVVMLHGNPTWSFFYRNLVKGLREGYRCVVPDHIGCGLSDKPGDGQYDYTLDSRVDDLEALLDHLGLRENLTLVLHDWGGMIGMAFASRRPGRVKRLVVLNTAAFLMPAGKKLPWQIGIARNTPLGPLLVRGLNAFSRGLVRYCAVQRLPPEVRAAYLAPYDSWRNRVAVLRFVQDIPLAPGDRCYGRVREVQEGLHRFRGVPTLICWGTRDFVFDGHFLAEWLRHFPGAEVHTLPATGHLVLEDEGAKVLALTRDFLRRHPL
jgi:pimeloyl-ACP methyl ester carboxylesterase